jgi:hypothetical protein
MRTVPMITAVLCLLVLPLAVPSAADAASPNLKPGLWQTTATSVMVGTPFSPPPQTGTSCLTKTQISHPWASLQANKSQHCKFTHVEVHAHSASWRMECNAKGGHMSGTGTTKYPDPKHMQGVAHMSMNAGGEQMKIDVTTVSHWVSASCKK